MKLENNLPQQKIPTPLPPEAIEEFRRIYKLEYHKEISFEHATTLATTFFNLMKVIYKPIKKKAYGKHT